MRIGRLSMEASRWPWQGYGWCGTSDKVKAPLAGGARFGAGWRWKLGLAIGGHTMILDLLFGVVRIEWLIGKRYIRALMTPEDRKAFDDRERQELLDLCARIELARQELLKADKELDRAAGEGATPAGEDATS